jgi:hypothetical protein
MREDAGLLVAGQGKADLGGTHTQATPELCDRKTGLVELGDRLDEGPGDPRSRVWHPEMVAASPCRVCASFDTRV